MPSQTADQQDVSMADVDGNGEDDQYLDIGEQRIHVVSIAVLQSS